MTPTDLNFTATDFNIVRPLEGQDTHLAVVRVTFLCRAVRWNPTFSIEYTRVHARSSSLDRLVRDKVKDSSNSSWFQSPDDVV